MERWNLKISTIRVDDKPISERKSLNKRGVTPCLYNSTICRGEALATPAVNARIAPQIVIHRGSNVAKEAPQAFKA